MYYRKASGGMGAMEILFILLIVAVFTFWLIKYSQRECQTNKDCGSEFYCGSDFSCHQFPIIKQEKVVRTWDYTLAALLIGVSIIAAAFIISGKRPSLDGIVGKKEETHGDDGERGSGGHANHHGKGHGSDEHMRIIHGQNPHGPKKKVADSHDFEHYGEDAEGPRHH